MPRAVEILHRGCGFAEGPVVLPDGGIAFCDGTHGRLLLHRNGTVTELADVGGAANGAALDADGALYVALMTPWHPLNRPVPPAVVRVDPDGTVTTVAAHAAGRPLVAPNDVAFGPDARLYLTDSGDPDHLAPTGPASIHALERDGAHPVLDLSPCFANGVGFDPEGALLWTETTTRRVCRRVGGQTTVVAELPEPHLPDGFAVAADGRIFVATVTSRAIVVLDPAGAMLDVIELGAEPTNCAFSGPTLVVTASTDSSGDPGSGMLLALETDAEPLPLHVGPIAG